MQLHPASTSVQLQWLSLLTQRLVIQVPVSIVAMLWCGCGWVPTKWQGSASYPAMASE